MAASRRPTTIRASSFADMVEVAQLAERGKFDFLFLADSAAVDLRAMPKRAAAWARW